MEFTTITDMSWGTHDQEYFMKENYMYLAKLGRWIIFTYSQMWQKIYFIRNSKYNKFINELRTSTKGQCKPIIAYK